MTENTLYNVVATLHTGATRRGVVTSIDELILSTQISIVLAMETLNVDLVMTELTQAPDRSEIDITFRFPDGRMYMSVAGKLVHSVDQTPAEMPQSVIDTVNDIWNTISNSDS